MKKSWRQKPKATVDRMYSAKYLTPTKRTIDYSQ